MPVYRQKKCSTAKVPVDYTAKNTWTPHYQFPEKLSIKLRNVG